MNDKLKELFEGMELSEDFKAKVSEILESAAEEKAQVAIEEAEKSIEDKYSAISEEYSQYVVSEMEDKTEQYIQEEIVPVVERYIDYASQEFMKENKMVIESETKVELADKFLSGFSALTESYNVEVPKGQDDVVAELKGQLKEAQERVDTLIQENGSLQESIVEDRKSDLIEDVSAGLTETQKERFAEAAQSVKYHSDEQFTEAMKELKESFYPVSSKETETLEEQRSKDEEYNRVDESAGDPWLKELFSKI